MKVSQVWPQKGTQEKLGKTKLIMLTGPSIWWGVGCGGPGEDSGGEEAESRGKLRLDPLLGVLRKGKSGQGRQVRTG